VYKYIHLYYVSQILKHHTNHHRARDKSNRCLIYLLTSSEKTQLIGFALVDEASMAPSHLYSLPFLRKQRNRAENDRLELHTERCWHVEKSAAFACKLMLSLSLPAAVGCD
jgi:hypothetical protein